MFTPVYAERVSARLGQHDGLVDVESVEHLCSIGRVQAPSNLVCTARQSVQDRDLPGRSLEPVAVHSPGNLHVPCAGSGNAVGDRVAEPDRELIGWRCQQEAVLAGNAGTFRWRLEAPDGSAVFDGNE